MSIEDIVLGTLSFYDSMNLEKIILDLDTKQLESFGHFSREDLDQTLKNLCKKRKIKKIIVNKEVQWIRLFPRRKNIFLAAISKIFKIFKHSNN